MRNIRTQLTLIVVFLAALPVIVVTIFTAFSGVQTAISNTESQLSAIVTLKDGLIDGWLSDQTNSLGGVITDEADLELVAFALPSNLLASLRDEAQNRLSGLLDAKLVLSPGLDTLFVADLDGAIFLSAGDPLTIDSLDVTALMADALMADSAQTAAPGLTAQYLPPVYNAEAGESVVIFLHPIVDADNQLTAILGGQSSLSQLNPFLLERSGLGTSGETYLVNADHTLLTPSRFEAFAIGAQLANLDIEAAARETRTNAIYQGYRNSQVIGVQQWRPDLGVALMAEIEQNEVLTPTLQVLGVNILITLVIISGAIIFGLRYVGPNISRPIVELANVAGKIAQNDFSDNAPILAKNELGQLATSFNDMKDKLRDSIENLENRVEERTYFLQMAAETSGEISRLLDIEQLLPKLVGAVQTRFNLSQVSIFLLDEETSLLNLVVASGDAGQTMMQTGKRFALGDRGLVPLAARTMTAQVINNVHESPDHVVNPLLPSTAAETTLPIIAGQRLVGVLDMQADYPGYFSTELVNALTTMAAQIGTTIQNADLFTEVQLARETAERSDHVKSAFLASMSHELRTPLNAVINFTKFVAKGSMGPVNAEQVETLNEVIDSARHLLNLINDVLDMSKIEAGSLTLFVEENVNVVTLVESVAKTARGLIKEKPIEFQVAIADDIPLIRGDRQRILQTLLNITSNACKFTDEGYIRFNVARNNGGGYGNGAHGNGAHGNGAHGEEILIAIQDSGPGIAPEDQSAVFEAFKQTETGLRQAGGTGLGMPISRSLVEAHGGRMWVESTVGEGATFYVVLPIKSDSLETSLIM